jgi:hypothetical protein
MIPRLEHRTKSPVLQKLARRYLHYFAHPVGRWGDLGNVLDGYVDSVMRRPDNNEAKRKLYSRGAGTHLWIQVQGKNSRPEAMLSISLDRDTSARGWTPGRDERADVTLHCMSRHIKGRLTNNECCSIWRHPICFRPGLASSLTLCDLARRFDWWVTEIASSPSMPSPPLLPKTGPFQDVSLATWSVRTMPAEELTRTNKQELRRGLVNPTRRLRGP